MKHFYLIATVIIAAIIFIFSSQNAPKSDSSSRPIAQAIGDSIAGLKAEQPDAVTHYHFISGINTFLRESAHFFLFLFKKG